MAKFSSFKKNADNLAAAIAGFLIIFLFTRHGGIGIDPDGVVYVTAAENLAGGGRLADFAHKPVVEFPAFYPVFLGSLVLITGLQPLVFSPVLNALLFASVIYISGYIMDHFLYPSKWYKRAILTCIVLSPGLLEIFSTLWSETLFILCLLFFMMAMRRYFQSYSRSILIVAAIVASVASVTRYAGVTIIATGGILLLLDGKLPIRRRLGDLVIYALISPLLLTVNIIRNYTVSGTFTGARESSVTPLKANMHDAGSVFCDWIPFLNGNYRGAGWITLFFIVALTWICLKRFLRYRRMTGYEDMAAFFSLVHILFMVVTASISRFETLNSRFMSPVFIPLIWSGSSWIVSAYQKTAKARKRWLLLFGVLVFLGFQYKQLAADFETWDGVKDAGIPGYTEDQWRYSETVLFIQKDSLPFRAGYTIYSNANDAIYFFTKRQGKFLPHKEDYRGVKQFLADPHCYVVWFNDGDNPDLINRGFIINTKKMKIVRQFSDGAIYEYGE